MEVSMMSERKAVIAAGGLKSQTIHPINLSKAMYPLINKPAILSVLKRLRKVGVSEVFFAVSGNRADFQYLPEQGNGLTIHYVIEDYPQGVAGCLSAVSERLRGHTILFISSNLVFFTEQDIEGIMNFHDRERAAMTVGLTPIPTIYNDTERVVMRRNSEIERVYSTHPSMDTRSYVRTSGMYVMDSSVLAQLKPGRYMDLKEQLIPQISEAGMSVAGWVHKDYHSSIRTAQDYLKVNFDLLKNPSLSPEHFAGYREMKSGVWIGHDVHINPLATIVRPAVIGNGVRIEEDSTVVGPCVIGEGCVLERNSLVRESVLWRDSIVPENFEVEKCLVSGTAFSPGTAKCSEMVIVDGEMHKDIMDSEADTTTTLIHKVVKDRLSSHTDLKGKIYPAAKRVLDFFSACFLLFLMMPVFAVVAVAIKLDSKGPAFFTQIRNGKGGRPFKMIKFRTMVSNSEEIKGDIKHLNNCDGPMFKIQNDPRETRIGRLLRTTSLDEIPQLINVFRGDMSLVGPRPLAITEMKFNPHWRDARLKLTPGMTGLWQLYGRDTNSFRDWIQYDLKYLDQRSFWLDIKIIMATALRMLKINFPVL